MAKLGNIFDFQDDPDRKNYDGSDNGRKKPPKQMIFYYLIVVAVILIINMVVLPAMSEKNVKEVSYNTLLDELDNENVGKVSLSDSSIEFTLRGSDTVYKTGRIDYTGEVDKLYASGAEFTQEIPKTISPIWILLYNLLPFAIMIGIGMWLSRRMSESMANGGGGGMFGGFGKSNAKVYEKDQTGVMFKDVAGEEEAKELLAEIVDFLHNPKKYNDIGAKIPKGALLVGPPGTGKTMLAKAVAGEADVPFFSISGSEFVEMFVGMGASKVRDLFKQAEKKAPCIIFIDEIDAIGKKRNGTGLGGNDEREQTLNQLLTEMDGFDGTKGIIVLAATNQPDTLDPALLRPGRFDRRVPVELPDMQGRVDILKVHAANVKMVGNINFDAIAKACPGASGAELANMINEAALRAVKAGRDKVNQQDLEESIEVVMAGYKKKNKVLTDKEKLIVAYHEVGHALVAAKQDNSAPVHKITIIPRTSGALGYTMQVDEEGNHYLYNKQELENKIATLTGGRAAEELIFKSITTGASNDIEQATKMARNMISVYGMSKDFGMVALQSKGNQYLGGDMSLACSEEVLAKADAEVIELVKTQYDKAMQILKDNIMKLHEIVKFLYEKETITGEEFMNILNSSVNTIEEQAKLQAEQQNTEQQDTEQQPDAETNQQNTDSNLRAEQQPESGAEQQNTDGGIRAGQQPDAGADQQESE